MSWKKLQAEGHLSALPTSKQEIDSLRQMVEMNLKDAAVAETSAQGRYEFAYNAARLVATILIRATGNRVGKTGHHYYTFQALMRLDPKFAQRAVYFDGARDKRNDFSYDTPSPPSDTDAEDLVEAVNKFMDDAEAWLAAKYPDLAKK
jgi:hypothetical protein